MPAPVLKSNYLTKKWETERQHENVSLLLITIFFFRITKAGSLGFKSILGVLGVSITEIQARLIMIYTGS